MENDKENQKIQWTEDATKLLLDTIRTYHEQFQNKHITQKSIWQKIARTINAKGYNVSYENCDVKWKSLKRTYKKIKDSNKNTGAERKTWQYFEVMDELLSGKPEIAPLSIASNIKGFQPRKRVLAEGAVFTSLTLSDDQLTTSKRRKGSDPQWMIRYREQMEKHHKENYEQRERFLQLFERHIESNKTGNNSKMDH